MADGYGLVTSITINSAATSRFIDAGQSVHVLAVFTNSVGTAANPAVVKFAYRADNLGVTTTYTFGTDTALVRPQTGYYYVDIDTAESGGRYEWNFYATGVGQAGDHDEFYVRPTGAV